MSTKRICDFCSKEIGSMRARYEILTYYPSVLSKEPSLRDMCYGCYTKARMRTKRGDILEEPFTT